MAGFSNETMYANNVNFSGAKTPAVTLDGQLMIGSTATPHIKIGTLTAGTGISITNGSGAITIATNGASTVNTLTGNTGGAISPTAGNINTLGTGSITISGSGSTLTTQLTGLTNHNVLLGAGTATITNLAPSATSGVPLISQGSSSDPVFGTAVVAGGGTGSTSFNINGAVYSNTTTTGALQAATLTSGQLLIGGTTTPAAATLTPGTGISITNGNNSITIAVTTGSTVVETLTGNSGGAISPTSGNINTLGTGSITVVGSGSTLTTQLTGLTNHAVLVGAGTATITNVTPSATSGVPLISQGSSADPTFGTALVAGGGTGATTLTGVLTGNGTSAITANTVTQHGVLIGGASNAVSSLGVGASSTVLAGSTGADPSFTATPTVTSITFGSGTALSVYAEGTFTPTLIGGTVAGSSTYVTQLGFYTKIGNMVTCWGYVLISAATGTGNATIGALPFTAKTNGGIPYTGSIVVNGSGWSWPAGRTCMTFAVGGGGTTGVIQGTGSLVGVTQLQMTNASLEIYFSIHYQV